MIVWLTAALAGTLAPPITQDFDGDGKPETVVVKDEQLLVPPLADVWCPDGMCELEVIDVASDKPGKELLVCQLGPRDDRSCNLLRRVKGAWSMSTFPAGIGNPARVVATGNGIVLGVYEDRWYSRVEKMTWADGALTHVKQPLLSVVTEQRPSGWTWKVDRSFPIYDAPNGKAVVANVAPGKDAAVVAESPDHLYGAQWDDTKRWLLVRTQSGLLGWATLASVIASSDALTLVNSAG